ncbi:MAG: hypothetical protein F2789_12765, partial [Actinobacteria bacterium]|nr:hypothetical protein [Actinomycetota bacterium]
MMDCRRVVAAFVLVSAVLPLGVRSAGAWVAGAPVDLGTALSPASGLSSTGDFATDTFSDPWDFSNPEDVIPVNGVGTGAAEVSVGGGELTVATHNASEIRLLMKWPGVLPWGRDGWAHPVDAARYTQTTMRIYGDVTLSMAIRFQTSLGQWGVIPFVLPAGWSTQHFDLLNRTLYPFAGSDANWSGSIVWFELFRGGAIGNPGDPTVNVKLDWVRLHRADASRTPPVGLPVPVVISPNIEGGTDYATAVRGNPWDFAGMDDVGETHDVAYLSTASGDLSGITVNNDPYIELPLGPPLNTDRYHRLTVDACYDGGFSLDDAPGGGMMGRVAWMPSNPGGVWTETQDIIVFPGCHRMTLDMVTSGPASLNDESSGLVTGWRGMRPNALRFDLNEDRGVRGFSLREVRLADDASFSTSYPITFADAAAAPGATADIYVTTTRGGYSGTRIARGLAVGVGVNTFVWDG